MTKKTKSSRINLKLTCLLAIFLTPQILSAQDYPIFPVDSSSNKVVYSGVVSTNGSKNDLYVKAKEWFVKTFSSANHVIQMDDKDAGKIMGKGLTRSFYTVMMTSVQHETNYLISVHVKDNRYKYEISNIVDEQGTSRIRYTLEELIDMVKNKKSGSSTIKKKVLPQIDESIKALLTSLNNYMTKDQTKKEDF